MPTPLAAENSTLMSKINEVQIDKNLEGSQHTNVLQKFRRAVEDCNLNNPSDEYLTRWLKVYDFDECRAEKMLRQTLEWRRVNKIDHLFKTYVPPEVVVKYFPFGEMGIDKFGCPIFVMLIGKCHFKGLLQSVTKKEANSFFKYLIEKMAQRVNDVGRQTDNTMSKMTFVIDMDSFSMKELMYKSTIEIIIETIRILFIHYPDILRRVFVINATKVFHLLFSMVKPVVPRNDLERILIYGVDRNEWTSRLLEEMEADQVFAYYGGTQTDPDGNLKCLTKWNMAGEVPRSYYLSSKVPVPKDNMETSNILAGSRKKIKLKIDVPLSVIRWEFMTEGGDIGFRVYYKDPKGDVVDLLPLTRIESHLIMEEGEITCEQAGKHVVEFDNTFSYLKAKKLRYSIVIAAPSRSN